MVTKKEIIDRTIHDLASEDCSILKSNEVLAKDFLKKLFEKIGRINGIINDIQTVISRGDVKSKILVNEMAWLADHTTPDHYGWDYVTYRNIYYLLYESYSLKLELIHGEKTDLKSLFFYKCEKNTFENENIVTTEVFKKTTKQVELTEEEMELYLNMCETEEAY